MTFDLLATLVLRALLDATPDALVLCDDSGTIVFANAQVERMFGYAPAELVGESVEALVPVTLREQHATSRVVFSHQRRERAVGAGTPLRALRKDGSEFHADIGLRPIHIHDRVLVLAAVREARAMHAMTPDTDLGVAGHLASVDTLAAGVAHEINNPLAAVMANQRFAVEELSALLDELRPAEVGSNSGQEAAGSRGSMAGRLSEVRDAIAEASGGAERVRRIVRDLKTFSHAEDGKRELLDLRRVIDGAVGLAWNEIRHCARLVREFDTTPAVLANEAHLGRVFFNLLVNAAQAIPEGGADRNEIRVRTFTGAHGGAVVEIRDTGEGIAPENLPRLFDPFFVTRPGAPGGGLGLAICRAIVIRLGGEIAVESRRGAGSTFRVTLPAAEAREPSGPKAETRPGRRRARILVIDDEPSVGTAMRRILSQEHDVEILTEARQALERIQSAEPVDVIFCDLMMPMMTGMELHAAVTERAAQYADRMVFMTGGAFTERSREFLEGTTRPCIEKPFDVDELRAFVRRFLAEREQPGGVGAARSDRGASN